LSIFLLLGVFSIVPTNKSNANKPVISEKAKVEVYYFHYTRRCATCQAVESEAKKDLDALYPALVKAGTIVFKSINLDEDGSTAIAET
ncbi:MAG TPA: nitrophenyl compound nitroreductase subunit ArsF family protein, partial [Bacteroidales bacterium]|nr:nitrophenyl compound nitroreductase subunit ArsF family protein [Bacteroidales bacterium]